MIAINNRKNSWYSNDKKHEFDEYYAEKVVI